MTSTPVIKCESVYKIFGANAEKMLQNSNGNVDAKTFQDAGCIVGVNNASFEVSKGEMLVVMGLSGSGKSTLLRCISRLTDATGGKIYIEGQLQTRKWEQDGQTRYTTEVIGRDMQFLDSRGSSSDGYEKITKPSGEEIYEVPDSGITDDDIPF